MSCNAVLCEPIKQEICYWCDNHRHSECTGVDEFSYCSCKCPFNENLQTKKCVRCNDEFKAECEHEELCFTCKIVMIPTNEPKIYCYNCNENGDANKMFEHAHKTNHSITNDRQPLSQECNAE